MAHPSEEKTVVLIKPDGVKRGLIGEIITRIEKRGLKIIALKMVWPTQEHIDKHYPAHDDWFRSIGERLTEFFKAQGLDAAKHFGTSDYIEMGKQTKGWLKNYLTEGPIVAMVIQGMHAISTVRKIVGSTYPAEALPGTIRGDFSVDAPTAANVDGRAVKNLIHASGNADEARNEVEHWFAPEEIHTYKRADEDIMF
ncbi:MAG: nucleoside-diphosphate kinase [Candidatus Niyogibacteria bacterium]|nr:nucleoside-diphosphate kinase [Candidatus Niyogibacteria bacterium]